MHWRYQRRRFFFKNSISDPSWWSAYQRGWYLLSTESTFFSLCSVILISSISILIRFVWFWTFFLWLKNFCFYRSRWKNDENKRNINKTYLKTIKPFIIDNFPSVSVYSPLILNCQGNFGLSYSYLIYNSLALVVHKQPIKLSKLQKFKSFLIHFYDDVLL